MSILKVFLFAQKKERCLGAIAGNQKSHIFGGEVIGRHSNAIRLSFDSDETKLITADNVM